MPKIIQFLHPSQEAKPVNDDDKIIQWNNFATHRRKFLLSRGEYINHSGELKVNDLTFWGEWEPQSEIIKIINPKPYFPKYLNLPYLDLREPQRTHTTDPYVFGNSFRYFICRQHSNRHILKNIEPGSIILFGSSINFKFCLDTLFVVSNNRIKYSSENVNQMFPIDKRGQFYYACIDPIFGSAICNPEVEEEDNCRANQNEEFVCYESLSFNQEKLDGNIYSFVPIKLYDKDNIKNSVFRQPEIELDFIQHAQTMGINSKDCTREEIQEYWNEISKQIENQNLLRGTKFKTPFMKQKNGG